MLILVRKPGQSLTFGDDITITVLDVSGDRVKIGIDAPRDVPIRRPEAVSQLTEENKLAAGGRPALRLIKGGKSTLPPGG